MYYYAHPYQNPLFVRTSYRSDLNPTCAPEAEAELSKNGSYPLVLAEISPDKGEAILLVCLWFQIAQRSADRGHGPVDDIGQRAFCAACRMLWAIASTAAILAGCV